MKQQRPSTASEQMSDELASDHTGPGKSFEPINQTGVIHNLLDTEDKMKK